MNQSSLPTKYKSCHLASKPGVPALDYEKLIELSQDVICTSDVQGCFLTASAAVEQVWGFNRQEIIGMHYMDLVVADDIPATVATANAIIEGAVISGFENRYRRKDGSIVWLSWSASWDKETGTMYSVARDITEQKRSREELQTHALRLSGILESLGDGFYTLDREFNLTYWNRKAEEITGIKKETALGRNLWELFPYTKNSVFFTELNWAAKLEVPIHFEGYHAPRQMNLEVSAYPSPEGLSVYFRNITELKKKELDLKISNERFEFVSRATSDAIWDCDIETKNTYYNESFTLLFGHPSGLRLSTEIWEQNIHPKDKEQVLLKIREALKDPSVSTFNDSYQFMKQDGSFAFVNDRAVIIRNEKGKAVRMVGTMQDITKQKETELLLQKSEKRFRTMVQSGQDLIALVDPSFQVQYISPNLHQLTGYFPEEVKGLLAHAHVHPEDYPQVLAEAAKVFEQATVHIPYFRFRVKDGTFRWLEVTLSNLLDDQDIQAVVCNIRDVSKRRSALDEVVKLSTVVQETTSSVVLMDASGRIEWVNPAFIQRTGYTLAEVEGIYALDLLNNAYNNTSLHDQIRACMQNKVSFTGEVVSVSKDGRRHWVELKAQPILDDRGNVKNFFTIQMDITDRKAAEEALILSEEKYKLLFYQNPSPKWIFNTETFQIVDVNAAACKLYGYSRQEFLQMTIPCLKVTEDKMPFLKTIQDALEKESKSFQGVVKHIKKNGEVFSVEISTQGIDLPSGLHFVVSIYDLTDRLALEQKIVEERMAAQKKVTNAIIRTQENERSLISKELHDNINQVLTAAKLSMENTLYYPDNREAFTSRSIRMVQDAIQEIRSLSRALKSPAVYESGLKVTLLELLDQYRNLQRFGITEDLSFNEDVVINELKLTIYRIVQELMNNIVKYAEASQVSVEIKQQNRQLNITVQDNGKGFDSSQKSCGLGLSNINSRVDLFKGSLQIKSSVGNGCTTSIVFPL